MRALSRAAALCVGLALGLPAIAAKHKDEHRHHEAHEHGSGQLNVALDGKKLIIELIVPAMNVVGFEHPPRNDAEHKAIEDARNRFARADSLFTFPAAAGCSSSDVHVTLGQLEDDDHGHEKEHKGHKDHDPIH